MHVLHVVGARPNLMKVAPVLSALRQFPRIKQSLIHTGQHYDTNMSDVFFQQLEIPAPDVNMGVGSGSHARQTADIMSGFEAIVLERKPDLVLVYGDVNSTVAAALVCSKLKIKVGHVEAGLRSFDRGMPEEDQPAGHGPACRFVVHAIGRRRSEPGARRHSGEQDLPRGQRDD